MSSTIKFTSDVFSNKMRLVCLTFFILTSHFARSQAGVLDSLRAAFTSNRTSVVREKVFVHTDKTFYLTGETLWFKSYVVEAGTHKAIDLSKVAYIELLGGKNKPALQAMIALEHGLGDGSFVLPASLSSGMYTLRAYTAWMKNFDVSLYFQTPIQIVNTAKRPDWQSLQVKETYTVQFFPEGGNLVDGMPSKVGFQLVNQYGEGVDGIGTVIKDSSDTVAHFRPLKFGIGSFVFTPQKDATYKAVFRLGNGKMITASLPNVYAEGYVMRLTDLNKEQLQINIATNKTGAEKIFLLASARGEIKISSSKTIINGKAEWVIDKKNTGEGITTFTFFDATGHPVCERLYFKKPLQKLQLDLTSDKKEYGVRSKVNLNLLTNSNEKDSLPTNLSLSVFLLDSLERGRQPKIESTFWLLSELKGSIEFADYYLENEGQEVSMATDNLMLTHGWRRFREDSIVTNVKAQFKFLPEYEGQIITGRVVNRQSGKPVPGVLCFLSAPGENFYAGNAISGKDGLLIFVPKNIYGPVELIVQPHKADSTLRIDLLKPYSENYPSGNLLQFSLSKKWGEQLSNRHFNMKVAASITTPKQHQFTAPQKGTSTFYGTPDKRYLLEEYTRFPTMEEVMREFIAEVNLYKEKDTFYYKMLNLPYRSRFDSFPLVLFDGVPIFNLNKLIAYDPLKVKKIDVVARKYFWGNIVNNGIVSYSTYNGDLTDFELDPWVLLLEYSGLQVKREFYSPSYDTQKQSDSREPDTRNVLLWMPNVNTEGHVKKIISFYTSDVPGSYAVRVEGVNSSGTSGSRVVTFEVR
ncbi:MAG: hypothetical protein JWR72_3830 [Flavisolibacter sp.]|nr:hypothetical protein [Flavisolibacter sp.]